MLTKMHKPVAKAITFVLFGLLILSFAVWGIGDIFRGPGRSTSVAEVGSIQIDQLDFERSLRQEINRLRSNFGGQIDFETARSLGIVEQTLQQLVNRALFDQQASALRMTVTEDQIKRQIVAERAFQNQFGDFDRLRYDNVLRTMGLSEAGYIATVSGDLNRQQIAGAISGLSEAPARLTEDLFLYGQERRAAEVIEIDRAAFEALPIPTEEDLAALHEERSGSFMTPETRSLTLLQLRAADVAGEIAVTEEDVALAFEERRDEFGEPERREVSQIVLTSAEEASAARQKLDEGMSFEAVAEETTGGAPIDLGALTRSELEGQLPELAEAVFSAAEGAVAAPVETGFGWHLAQVTSVAEGREPVLSEVREQITQDLALERAVDTLIEEANRLDDELAGGATLEEAAATLDVELTKVAAIDAQGLDADGAEIEGLPPLDDLLPVVRGTDVGNVSLLAETPDGDHFVLRVDGISPAVLQPLDEVRDAVVAAWEERERDRLAQERAEALAARAEEGVELSKIAVDEGLSLFLRGPVDRFGQGEAVQVSRALAGRMFEMTLGDVASIAGENGWLVAKLADISRPDPGSEPEALETVNERVVESINGDLLASFSTALREETEITVNSVLIQELTNRY